MNLGQSVDIVMVACDAEILSQVDDFYVLGDGVLAEELRAFPMSEAEKEHVDAVERERIGKAQIGVAEQPLVYAAD